MAEALERVEKMKEKRKQEKENELLETALKDALSARKAVPSLGGQNATTEVRNTLGSAVGDGEIDMHAIL